MPRTLIEEPTINLTPLIDVVFVILIMFILVAPLLERDQITLAKAGKNSPTTSSTTQRSTTQIHLRQDGTILLNQQTVSYDQLAAHLKQTAHVTPQLFPDRLAPFGAYQAIKNCAEEAGCEKLDVILSPP
ncbi:MAG: biopolymer transporter ExbD [Chlamydiia bacterium]|nr:biopolymer transporter ExbD [Chlamydiia bacterium]